MIHLATILGLYGVTKLVIVAAASSRIFTKAGSWAMAAALSWIGLQIGLMGFLLLLSPFGMVGGAAVWLFLGAILALLMMKPPRLAFPAVNLSPTQVLAALGAVAVFGALFYRSLIFFDTTWDALVYELPRVAFYKEGHSLLVSYKTEMINIFANEWNGEFVALVASLASGTDQAMGFGGAEIWIWGWIALIAVAQRFGARPFTAWSISLALMTTPALLGLSMVVKGDLLAILALSLGSCCFFPAETGDKNFLDRCALVILVFAAGAKVAVVLAALPLAAWVVFELWRSRQRWQDLVPVALFSGISGSRYILNLFVYHNPVKRVAGEHAIPSCSALLSNIRGIAGRCIDPDFVHWGAGFRWVLGLGLGAVGWLTAGLLVFGLLFGQVRRNPSETRFLRLFLPVMVGSWLIFAYCVPWLPWAFRYHLPWITMGLIFILASATRALPLVGASSVALLFVAIAPLQTIYTWGRGEELPVPFAEARKFSQLGRKLCFHPYIITDELQAMARSQPMTVAVFQQPNSCIFPFFGEDSRHHVCLVDSLDALVETAHKASADAIVIAGPRSTIPAAALAGINTSSYNCVSKNVYFMIFYRATARSSINKGRL